MATDKQMGYKAGLFYGTKGATATTRIKCRRDVTCETTPQTGETTCAGDGDDPPKETGEAVAIGCTLRFNMVVNENANAAVDLKAAAATGDPIALRFVRKTGGLGPDGDAVVQVTEGAPYKGEQTIDVNVVAWSDRLRDPEFNVLSADAFNKSTTNKQDRNNAQHPRHLRTASPWHHDHL